ncbi:Xaa-Pro aminopeptidase [Breznakibacter xylanolyticus]|uniref:Xaa-Pro aminopeptidase n=1 Tax=Breznakibacter xylanolyticus TaxID=990 RepID=A0A2W7N796_9BACT|nr:aminopeptidase P family protein [Breznakibacter xylanolyticus]PZX12754.1 Xaa-Pro aminopeptidase [Breznakibacter xylanolyticus]
MLHNERIFELRSRMAAAGIQAYIISDNDQHLSEYIADHWKFREWMSGFSGSRGKLVITEESAGLWVDSRYFLQAEEQLKETFIKLFRMGEPGVPGITEWLAFDLMAGNTVGLDGTLFSVEDIRNYKREFKKADLRLEIQHDLMSDVWLGRPDIPECNIFSHPTEIAGMGRVEKLAVIRQQMRKLHATHYIVGALDEIAWALNLRSEDVPYNPVFHAFMIISPDSAQLFVNPHKVTSAIGRELTGDGIKISLYESFYRAIKEIPSYDTIFIYDPLRLNALAVDALHPECPKKEVKSIIGSLKAIKSEAEIQSIEKVMVDDGVAMISLLHWLEDAVPSGKITEMDVVAKANAFRASTEGYMGESFATIAGYQANGAIVHYSVTSLSNAVIRPEGFLLIDSGGQYMGGTTDITRTIAMGKLSQQAKIDYTCVLKGHIALAKAVFPKGTRGVQLDAVARHELWRQGLNYGHGTGHGVGCFLNVHEGPLVLSPSDNGVPLEPGMLTSNEPGVYRAGEYGIRIENLVLTQVRNVSAFGEFYQFRTMTLCPIDTVPVVKDLLTPEEIAWLNDYHGRVEAALINAIDPALKDFLKEKCKKI